MNTFLKIVCPTIIFWDILTFKNYAAPAVEVQCDHEPALFSTPIPASSGVFSSPEAAPTTTTQGSILYGSCNVGHAKIISHIAREEKE